MTLIIHSVNHSHIRVETDDSIARELHDAFSFIVPGFRYTPAYKVGRWDGRIHLFDLRTRLIYAGLRQRILQFAKDREYPVEDYSASPAESLETAQISSWAASLGLPGITPRDYQIAAIRAAVGHSGGRALIVSPTGSGKSLIAYLLYRWYRKKTLLIVPTVGLVNQMAGDFQDFACPDDMQLIFEGHSKEVNAPLVITTWQSIYRLPKEWFDQFEMVIGDECHLFKATSLVTIMTKLSDCQFRFGLTGTLDDSKINGLTLEGLFGPVYQSTTTADLIENKVLANFKIECLTVRYPEEERKACRALKYAEELDYLVRHPRRNNLIKELVLKLKGNTLVLFQFVEKHGKELYELIKKNTNRPVYYISGEIKAEEREMIRKGLEKERQGVRLEFSHCTLLIPFETMITLSNGITKKASQITTNDDISDEWISSHRDEYKYELHSNL